MPVQAERAAPAPAGSARVAARSALVCRARAAARHAASARAASLSSALAVLVALAARLPYFTRSDFPLNDGGMFVAMSRDLLDAHFALPAFTSYNVAGIPFAYPPVAFYLVALLSGATGVDAVALARILPLAANLATVAAVAVLARSLLGLGWAAFLAPAVFALIPRSYEWLIMGGGLTRSFGLLFAVASLDQAHRLFSTPSLRRAGLCAALAALALATHLEMGLFALDSIALMALLEGRSLRAVLATAAVGTAVGVLTAPWWASVVARHGLSPFAAASATGGWSSIKEELAALQDFTTPPRLVLTLPSALAVVGALVCLLRGQLFVPVWLPAIFFLLPRSAPSEATVPLALLASVGLADVVAPGVASAVGPGRRSRLAAATWRRVRAGWRSRAALVVGPLAAVSVLTAVFVSWPRMQVNPQTLGAVSAADRQAMRWVAERTGGADKFLVLTPTWSWEEDRVGEWFPVLAQRRSIVTPQGAEWLPASAHARAVCAWLDVRSLGSAGLGVDELDTWASDRGVDFSAVFVSQPVPGPVNWGVLVASAEASPNYTVAYAGDGVAVLQRRQPIVPRWGAPGELAVASDCQAFVDQPDAVRWTFEAVYGVDAAQAWVAEHQQALGGRVPLCRRLAPQLGVVQLAC